MKRKYTLKFTKSIDNWRYGHFDTIRDSSIINKIYLIVDRINKNEEQKIQTSDIQFCLSGSNCSVENIIKIKCTKEQFYNIVREFVSSSEEDIEDITY